MAKLFFPLRLAAVLLSVLLRTVSGVTLDQLFIIQGGTTHGGCDDYFDQMSRTGILDNWLEEVDFGIDQAINAIDMFNDDIRVRRSMKTFFGINSRKNPSANALAQINNVKNNLNNVLGFIELLNDNLNGDRYLFCGSDYLARQTGDSPAEDWDAQDIRDSEGNIVNINGVPEYATILAEDGSVSPWWSGDFTPLNGYYFSDTGGDYCDLTDENGDPYLGLTSTITELERGPTGQPTERRTVTALILCPASLTRTTFPATYAAGDAMITTGTNLAKAVPLSSTLLHEAFHIVFGVNTSPEGEPPTGFLEGDEEYNIGKCIEWALADPINFAQRNPENYVFFITHMYYLFGVPEPGAGTSITTNWDFAPTGRGSSRAYAAIVPGPRE